MTGDRGRLSLYRRLSPLWNMPIGFDTDRTLQAGTAQSVAMLRKTVGGDW
jgi:hypothetical protein